MTEPSSKKTFGIITDHPKFGCHNSYLHRLSPNERYAVD